MTQPPPTWSPPAFALLVAAFAAVAYALALAAAALLLKLLGGPWQRSAGAHWTERARQAYAPGHALIWLALLVPALAGFIGEMGCGVLTNPQQLSFSAFWLTAVSALAGVLTIRYRWVRQLWGPRVTPGYYFSGCLVLLLAFLPHLAVFFTVLFLMPDEMNLRGALIFGVGFLFSAFLARGGAVVVLRSFGLARTAPPETVAMVQALATEMKVPRTVRVLELKWPQVNAVAWVTRRTVAFSSAMLSTFTADEVRAVTAHELAHLLEPAWVKTVRVIHALAYLPLVLPIKYGGTSGELLGFGAAMVLPLAYRRFGRKFEERADRLQRDALADGEPYMRSMIRLHETNLMPAVMPGAQTHPHLYDRLLAGGITPDFPRPLPPSRSKPVLSALAMALATAAVMFAMVIAIGIAQNLLRR